MMKILATIFLISLSLSIYGQDYYFVNAKNGLNVRAEGNMSAEKIAKIRYGTIVEIVTNTDETLTINDKGQPIKGKFVQVVSIKHHPTTEDLVEGYVFDGYLKKMRNKDIVTTIEIDKPVYTELFKKATTKNYKPQKITNLKAVKAALKGRVEWFAANVQEAGNGDGMIKNITMSNGQKLSFDADAMDIVFAEDDSGYFPEHDILYLEGGHSSDVCFSIKTGESELTIGNPEHIIPSPKNTYRLNGYFGGQECISYFFQKKENEEFTFLTEFNWDYDICYFKEFYWINETEFIYIKMNYKTDHENVVEEYFKGKIKDEEFSSETPSNLKSSSFQQVDSIDLEKAAIKQLKIDPDKIVNQFFSTKQVPGNAKETILFLPIMVEESKDYFAFNAYILIVNSVTGKIIHQYYERSSWVSDAIILSKITIDTAPYTISENDRAFGIRAYYHTLSQPNPYGSSTISLFVKSDHTLKQILKDYEVRDYRAEWDLTCTGQSVGHEKTLTMISSKTNACYDILVKDEITESASFPDANGDCNVDEKLSVQKTVLKFNGEGYTENGAFSPLDVYLDDPDKNATNIRQAPNGKIILKLDEKDDYFILTITEEKNGWFKLEKVIGVENDKIKIPGETGWIHHSVIGVSTRKKIELLDAPGSVTISGKIGVETGVKIKDRYLNWVLVEYEGLSGWVESMWLCGNPVTTCP